MWRHFILSVQPWVADYTIVDDMFIDLFGYIMSLSLFAFDLIRRLCCARAVDGWAGRTEICSSSVPVFQRHHKDRPSWSAVRVGTTLVEWQPHFGHWGILLTLVSREYLDVFADVLALLPVSLHSVSSRNRWIIKHSELGMLLTYNTPHFHPGLPWPSHPVSHRHSSVSLFCCATSLHTQTTRTNFTDRAFRCSAPAVWNSLTADI